MANTFKSWVRLAALLMLTFGTLVAVVNPPQVFFPVAFGLVMLMFAAGLVWLLTVRSWFRGLALIFELGGVAGMLVLALFALTRGAAVQEKLTVAALLGNAPNLGLSSRDFSFHPVYGPQLVRSDRAMESRCGWVRASNPIVQDRGESAYCWASLRLRGRSDAQILADSSTGPIFFLGTLAAESAEPFWWQSAPWLKKDLPLHPSSGWKMGMLPPDWARAAFQSLVKQPSHDSRLLEAMLFIALRRPDFATREQLDSLLEAWAAQRTAAGFSIEAALALRRELAGVSRFEFPQDWPASVRDSYRETLAGFLRAQPNEQGEPVRVTAGYHAWDRVRYEQYDDEHRDVVEQHGGGLIRAGSVSVATSPYTTHRDVSEKVRKELIGPLTIPTLTLEVGGKMYRLPPSSLVSRSIAESSSGPIYDEYRTAMMLEPWRFGLYWPNASDDGWKCDEAQISRKQGE
jgi:hypothetical protein